VALILHTLKPISSQLCKLEKVHGLHTKPMLILWGPHAKSTAVQSSPSTRILLGFQPGHVVETQLVHRTCEIRAEDRAKHRVGDHSGGFRNKRLLRLKLLSSGNHPDCGSVMICKWTCQSDCETLFKLCDK